FLTIQKGKQMELRRGGSMIDFAMPGTQHAQRAEREPRDPRRGRRSGTATEFAQAQPMAPREAGQTSVEAAALIRATANELTAAAKRPAEVATFPITPLRKAAVSSDATPDQGKQLAQVAQDVMSEARHATDRGAEKPFPIPTTSGPDDRPRRKIETYSAVFT